MDGRIGPGSIPAILQGVGVWVTTGIWTAPMVADAPAQPVAQVVIEPGERGMQSSNINLPRPQMTVRASWWARGLGLTGSGAAFFPYLKYSGGQTPTLAPLLVSQTDAGWIRFAQTVVTAADASWLRVHLSARPQPAGGGLAQVCGFQLSIIGAMPV